MSEHHQEHHHIHWVAHPEHVHPGHNHGHHLHHIHHPAAIQCLHVAVEQDEGVHRALQEIRVANTHPTGIELLQRQNEKKVKAAIRALDKKKSKPGSKRRKRKEDDEEEGIGSKADEEKRLELLIAAPPTRQLQTLQDMRKAAGRLYSFARQQSKSSSTGRLVGKPRIIFPEIVEDIRRMHDEQLLDLPLPPVLVEYAQPRAEAGAVKLRPLSARAAIGTRGHEEEQEAGGERRKAGGEEKVARRPRSANAALRRSKALQRKEELFREREAALLDRICTRDGTHATRYESLQRAARQRAFLVLLALLGVGRHVQAALRAHQLQLKAEAAPPVKTHNALLMPWAARVISRWWRLAKIIRMLHANSRVLRLILRGVMRFKNSLALKKKRAAADILRRFVVDITNLGDVKKVQMHRYCLKILRLQKYIRAFLKIQLSRLMLLHAAVERIAARRQRQRQIKAARDERLSLRAMAATAGFARVMTSLPRVQAKIRGVLDAHEASERRKLFAALSSQQADLEADEDGPSAARQNQARRGAVSGQAHKNESRSRLWLRGMQANPHTASQLGFLKNVLKSQRRRHVLTIDESRRRLKTARRQVNEGALREFLRKPDVHDGMDRVFDIIGADGAKIKDSAASAVMRFPPFLLLGGALPYLEQQLPDSFFEVV